MPIYHRRLPHIYEIDQPAFLTWRLYGSLPANREFPAESQTSGKVFAIYDSLLDKARVGPTYLRQPTIARLVVETLLHTQTVLKRCTLHAFVVMPNHVHVLTTPAIPVPQLTKTIKSFTANQANRVLGRTGNPFWQNETYDHLVRDATSFEKIRHYIEHNPVRAGLVHQPADHKWSSAAT